MFTIVRKRIRVDFYGNRRVSNHVKKKSGGFAYVSFVSDLTDELVEAKKASVEKKGRG